MAERSSISGQIVEIFEAMNIEVPSQSTDLFDTGTLDSLAFVQLLLHLEEQLGVTVGLQDIKVENFRTIQNIVEFVNTSRCCAERVAG